MQTRFLRALLCAAGVCIGLAPAAASDDAATVLKTTAQKFWAARVQEDWKTVHQMMSPGEHRPSAPAEFIDAQTLGYVSVEVGDVAVEGDVGFVDVTYAAKTRKFPELPPRTVRRWDLWRSDAGVWAPVPVDQLEAYPSRPQKVMPAADVARLTQRCREFWEARVAGNGAAMYDFLEPAYRAQMPRDQFAGAKSMYKYVNPRVDWVDIVDDRGRVRVTFTSKPTDPTMSKLDPRETSESEPWSKVDGEWYRNVKEERGKRPRE